MLFTEDKNIPSIVPMRKYNANLKSNRYGVMLHGDWIAENLNYDDAVRFITEKFPMPNLLDKPMETLTLTPFIDDADELCGYHFSLGDCNGNAVLNDDESFTIDDHENLTDKKLVRLRSAFRNFYFKSKLRKYSPSDLRNLIWENGEIK
jgi:hypothetical protein